MGEFLLEEFARVPTEVEYASELRYRNPPMSDRTLVFAITQSGETADTLAALRECKRKGHPTLAICNTVGSTIAREADGGIYLHAGPEIGVASTKAFTSQVTVLTLLALHLGQNATHVVSGRSAHHSASCAICPTKSARLCSAMTESVKWPTSTLASTTFCTLVGSTTSRSRWKVR